MTDPHEIIRHDQLSDPYSLERVQHTEALIEPFKSGGVIEHALGAPQQNMDGIVSDHLDKVAILEARGYTAPERPVYIFNPDARVLIKFGLRRDENPARSGFFADVVELDEEGSPRHGVSEVNPFQTETGFIPVSVGENGKGFTPSHVDMELEDADPLTSVPPNIGVAELQAIMTSFVTEIPEGTSLKEHLARMREIRQEQRTKALERSGRNYLPTHQGLDDTTNPYIHLIVTDRDASGLAEASRALGIFPIVKTVDEMIDVRRLLQTMGAGDDVHSPFSFTRGNWLGEGVEVFEQDYVPSVITLDYPFSSVHDPETGRQREVPSIEFPDSKITRNDRRNLTAEIVRGLRDNNPVFATLINEGWSDDLTDIDGSYLGDEYAADQVKVEKLGSGNYEQMIIPEVSATMKNYTDWLRKVRMDMALTFYLRGLSEL